MRGRSLFFLLFLGCGGFLGLNDDDDPPPTPAPANDGLDASVDGAGSESGVFDSSSTDAGDGGGVGPCGPGEKFLFGDDFSSLAFNWGPTANAGGTCTRLDRIPLGPGLIATRVAGTQGILCQPITWPFINGSLIRTLRVSADIIFPDDVTNTEYTFVQIEGGFDKPQLRLSMDGDHRAVIQTRPSANQPDWEQLVNSSALPVPISTDPIPVLITLDMTGDKKITISFGAANRSDLEHPLVFDPELFIRLGTSVSGGNPSLAVLATRFDNVRLCATH